MDLTQKNAIIVTFFVVTIGVLTTEITNMYIFASTNNETTLFTLNSSYLMD